MNLAKVFETIFDFYGFYYLGGYLLDYSCCKRIMMISFPSLLQEWAHMLVKMNASTDEWSKGGYKFFVLGQLIDHYLIVGERHW